MNSVLQRQRFVGRCSRMIRTVDDVVHRSFHQQPAESFMLERNLLELEKTDDPPSPDSPAWDVINS